jgi:ArsR family transcriptional regulator, lead/cadmium/zinc/bismuth-responsive transcriptional repressor
MRLFKVLANDSRLRLLHALERAGELCVTDLASEVQMTHRPCRTSSSASRIGGSW